MSTPWATGFCSAHQEPDPRCRICNPANACVGVPMKHATFLAIARLSDTGVMRLPTCPNVKACDWTEVSMYATAFTLFGAEQLLAGRRPWSEMPDCPACLVFMDMALECRTAELTQAENL